MRILRENKKKQVHFLNPETPLVKNNIEVREQTIQNLID